MLALHLNRIKTNLSLVRLECEGLHRSQMTMRNRVLECVRDGNGRTCEDVCRLTCLKHQTVSVRLHELSEDGLIYDSGRRRRTSGNRPAIVWEAK